MILESVIKVKLNSKNIEHYKSKGYDVSEKEIKINTIDLISGSSRKINVRCDICNYDKILPFREYMRSYNNGGYYSCSAKCSMDKNKITNLKNYGVENVSQIDEIKKRKEETCLNNHGMKFGFLSEKSKYTLVKNYGVDNPTKNKEIYSKVRETLNEKFGNEVMFKTKYFSENRENYYRRYANQDYINERKNYYLEIGHELKNIDLDGIHTFKCLNNDHTYEISTELFYRRGIQNINRCTICNPVYSFSCSELSLLNFIKSIYNGKIILNSREIIKPYELDIYLPELNIAFEFNGIFCHSDYYKDKKYHKNKYFRCKDLGIELIQIWEDIWCEKEEIIKSFIGNKLNVLNENVIYARNCKVVEYFGNTKMFLDDNHIQGNSKSKIKLGLEYKGELVSLMTFSKNRYGIGRTKNGEFYELNRFCNKINYRIVGAASKLLKYFTENYKYEEILSYSDCDISEGNLYEVLKFDFDGYVEPSYYYIKNGKRHHRFKFRKSNLIKNGLLIDGETEKDAMKRLGYHRIYNSGHKRYILR